MGYKEKLQIVEKVMHCLDEHIGKGEHNERERTVRDVLDIVTKLSFPDQTVELVFK